MSRVRVPSIPPHINSGMTQLSNKNFQSSGGKDASGGPYKGKSYKKIAQIKINENKPFILGKDEKGAKVYGRVLDIENSVSLSYSSLPGGKANKTDKITSFLKDADFGGMGGNARADQAKNTGPTESGCAFYCSLAFNVVKGKLTQADAKDKQKLKKAADFVEATSSLDDFLKNGPEDWHEENVYMNTANAVYEMYKNKIKSPVYCHRGSKFMNNIYEAYKSAKKLDAKEEKIAPGSFNADKWNPGDIWLSSFNPTSQPLKECRNFAELKQCVLSFAGQDGRKNNAELVAVSLKKPGNPAKADVQEFNTKDRSNYKKGEVKYQGFTYGRSGDFFSSNDLYIYVGGQMVQFRAFNTTYNWQGNIIGTGALGGKIGGGNIEYYLKKTGLGSLSKGSEFKETLDGQLGAKDYKLLFDLYVKYFSKQKVRSPTPLIISVSDFEQVRKSKGKAFTWQKLMGMRVIDLIEKASSAKRDDFATELIRYAASNTDISTYFIKVK